MKSIKVPGEFSGVIGGRLADLEEQGLQEVEIHNRKQLELIFFGDHRESEEREKFLDRFEPIGEMKLVRL
ncbi:MAG: hypothetical protein ACYCY8_04800 [Burkholderiales bacterium]